MPAAPLPAGGADFAPRLYRGLEHPSIERMIFQDLPAKQLAILWLGATVVAGGAVVSAQRVEAWARPGDFVEVCTDSVPSMPAPSAGLEPRVEVLDSMIACTERMEVQYIDRGATAARTSIALYALVALLLSVALIATWRSVRGSPPHGQ